MKKINRLLKNEDFQSCISKKIKHFNQSFTMYYSYNSLDHIRIGVSVSKKIGGAIIRNKIKRQVRMMCQDNFPINYCNDVVIIVSKNYLQNTYEVNQNNLIDLIKRINFKENKNNEEK